MFSIVLFEPEIPPNTGNIIRLCANTGFALHLVEPLGFTLDEPRLRRAGLDYAEWAAVRTHTSWAGCLEALGHPRLVAFTTRASRMPAGFAFAPGDALVFGPESRGLPVEVLESVPEPRRLRIPMRPGNRSLNLSNAVAVAAYEAWRQMGYAGS
ncbi:MAG: tRNA (cytidine(34)-2'-O)-methyltransferase [Ectothiorhodospiraceae bacterium]|nr:tRNA (cytidine(34)-2'-O)-methyltransferase [Ectothiorhodospiraceae bacterium]